MAPNPIAALLSKRQNGQIYDCNDPYVDCNNSTWDNWGRWVALVVVIVCIVILGFLFACYNNRRRRNLGRPPMYGTGWMPYGHPPPQNQPAPYYSNDQYNGPPAPPYSPPVGTNKTGNTFTSNEGYYGHHGTGYGPQQGGDIELQQPSGSYQPQRGGDPVYEAPPGPPPRKS